jgi:hypothetical protein
MLQTHETVPAGWQAQCFIKKLKMPEPANCYRYAVLIIVYSKEYTCLYYTY